MATTSVNTIRIVRMEHMPVASEHMIRRMCAEKPAMESHVILVWTVERIRACFAATIISVGVPGRCVQLITVHLAGLRRSL